MIPYHVYLHFLIIVRTIKIIYIFTLYFHYANKRCLRTRPNPLSSPPPSIDPLSNKFFINVSFMIYVYLLYYIYRWSDLKIKCLFRDNLAPRNHVMLLNTPISGHGPMMDLIIEE